MPVKDIYQDTVKRALQKDGWIITHDPFPLQIGQILLKNQVVKLIVFDNEREAIVQWIPN